MYNGQRQGSLVITQTMQQQIARFLVYTASVFISWKFADGYWVVGPVFGLAVVVWDSKSLKDLQTRPHVAFIIASTLIYALVFKISSQRLDLGSEFLESLFGSFAISIIIGSLLLPLAHKIFFKTNEKMFMNTVFLLILSYYFVVLMSLIHDMSGHNLPINMLFLLVALWQGVYLYSFFSKKS